MNHFNMKTTLLPALLGLFALTLPPVSPIGQEADPQPGLQVTFIVGETSHTTLRPNVWLYVPSKEPPSPFLPPGPFKAVFEGFVSVDLRDDYQFRADHRGAFTLEINGETVLTSSCLEGQTDLSDPIRLHKGPNPIKVTFHRPDHGDAFIRLQWSGYEVLPEPIPLARFSHSRDDPPLQKSAQLSFGRQLFLQHRCAKCHRVESSEKRLPELAMDAPSFEGIGQRRQAGWMAEWIEAPAKQRAPAKMPQIFYGPEAKEKAAAVAAYLGSLKGDPAEEGLTEDPAGQAEAGRTLFNELHCIACHDSPATEEQDPTKIPLAHVAHKFQPGALMEFLLQPNRHYAWIEMPNFKLAPEEAAHLAAYLIEQSFPPEGGKLKSPSDRISRGKQLVQSSGCLNCHDLALENRSPAAPSLEELRDRNWNQGCLAATPEAGGGTPFFEFTAAELEALKAFGTSHNGSLQRHVPAEFAQRQFQTLNCRNCHGRFEGFPDLELLGSKLKPEWIEGFLKGEIDAKPRPWIDARMPLFETRATELAHGMATLHGYPPDTPRPSEPIDHEKAEVGRKLVSGEGGFFCISCHGIGEMQATQVFESAGINLAYAGQRLRKDYFHLWLRNPLRLDPQTKMPVYFDEEGRSPLFNIYDGDGKRQIEALWHYVRQGEEMKPPKR